MDDEAEKAYNQTGQAYINKTKQVRNEETLLTDESLHQSR